MRIIGGRLRGRKLQTFKGSDVRPTSDRVRESIFNILGQTPVNASVLDLFSGTGALGIEAISRGARRVVFVDDSKHALTILRKNLEQCALQQCSQAIQWNIARNLNCLKIYHQTFDLVFMDPPYNQDLVPLAIKHMLQSQCLAPKALLVAEHEADVSPILNYPQITPCDLRRYGRTGISIFSYRAE